MVNVGDIDRLEEQARVLYEAGDIDGAHALLKEATQIAGCPASVWMNFGMTKMALGRFRGAVTAYSHVVSTHPEAFADRGLAYDRLGKTKQARVDYRAALRFNPDDLDTLVNLGTLEVGAGHPHRARALLEHAVRLDPTANWALSMVYESTGDIVKQKELLRLALDAGEPRALLDLALIAQDAGDDALYKSLLTEAAERGVARAVEWLEEDMQDHVD